MNVIKKITGSKFSINVLFSIVILFLGFITQVYVKHNFGLEVLGLSVLIRLFNSETFYYFVDLGLGEEVLFEREINKGGFYFRIVFTVLILFFLSINIDLFNKQLKNDCYYLFFMMFSSYLLFLNKLYYKKENKIKVIRIMDLIISVVFLTIYAFTIKLQYVIFFLTLSNLIIFLTSFNAESIKVFNLTDSSFSFLKSSSYYITSLSSKLEGSLLHLVIPAVISTDLLGKYDLITKIPKAFKSQLGELNSLKKYDFLYHSKRNSRYSNKSNNISVFILSLVVLILTFIYLYFLEIEFSLFHLFVIISELLIGLFFNKFNIRFVELFLNIRTRMKFVTSSFLRSISFLVVLYFFIHYLDFQLIMGIWYLSFFFYFFFIYVFLLKRDRTAIESI